MSLKTFHVVFIVAAILLVLFCGFEAFGSFRTSGSLSMALASLASVGVAAGLIRYERLFLRRCRQAGIR